MTLFKLIDGEGFWGAAFTDEEFTGLESVPGVLRNLGSRRISGKVVLKMPQEIPS